MVLLYTIISHHSVQTHSTTGYGWFSLLPMSSYCDFTNTYLKNLSPSSVTIDRNKTSEHERFTRQKRKGKEKKQRETLKCSEDVTLKAA